ncbi:MAG: nitrogenase [Spirochaetaceae bacterium]|jgi:nitrogenase molybdenum-iron protein alpha chain|nr:nitrogenase [Spirochaetaceae bacterium]
MSQSMTEVLKNAAFPVRENRLGSITGYNGVLSDLVSKSCCGDLKNRERCFSQSSLCLSMCALGQLMGIRDVAIVYHAPSGCCAGASPRHVLTRQIAARIGVRNETVMIGTDMNERDTVFGATDDVRDITKKVFEECHPKVIFLASSCVSGVIGEDMDSVAEELSNELSIPVESVHCEGFKSRIWASGFDIADHAVIRSIVKPPKEKRNVINFKNFYESARPEITEIFARLGVTPQFLYMNSTVEELSHISESLATVCICGTLGTYLGNALEEKYGVPYIRTINPLGIEGFEIWLRKIGETIGKEKEVELFLQEERAKYMPEIEKLKTELKGLRAVIGMGPGYTYEVSRVLQELGIETVWAAAWHYDYKYDNGDIPPALNWLQSNSKSDIKLSVADMQNYEILNIINTHKPDLYFSRHPGSTVWAIKQGVAALYVADEYMIFGYRGMLNFAKSVADTIRNRSFEKNLAARIKLPYTDWWYTQQNDAMLLPAKKAADKTAIDKTALKAEVV